MRRIAKTTESGGLAGALDAPDARGRRCFHCGTLCPGAAPVSGEKSFCCLGCLAVFELLTTSGLDGFYRLGESAGVRVKEGPAGDYKYLDEPAVRERLADFADGRITRVTFLIPAIHCIACVWLLENLFRLKPGIGASEVNFLRKQATITFEHEKLALSELVSLLASLGYEPELKLSDLDRRATTPVTRRLWMQTGVAGFAFGNIMLFSISSYLGLDTFNGGRFRPMFGWLSLLLAIPVLCYSAADYWRAAWLSLRRRSLAIEVPIALGIVALFAQSAYEVIAVGGEGYFDSFSGLLFFLLCGKLFQHKTFDRLAFDRDYKSFFPLSVARRDGENEERISLSQLRVGDRLVIHNGELVPADSRLISGSALIDYSFVTGESEPVPKIAGDHLYCGGRQIGTRIEIATLKDVSQSQLSSLWNHEALRKERTDAFDTLTNRYSGRFTMLVIGIAVGAAVFWWFREPAIATKTSISVLIVACPCALALAAPFALGTAQRALARRGIFLRNPQVVEALARVDSVVFDKTGTLTAPDAASLQFHGAPLTWEERGMVASLARHSSHPLSVRIAGAFADGPARMVRSFVETAGCGVEGVIDGHEVWLGSAAWLASRGVALAGTPSRGSQVHVAVDRRHRGFYSLVGDLRPEVGSLIRGISGRYELAMLSGDNERERGRFESLFGSAARLHFNQSPLEKLEFIRERQKEGRVVMMVGDGLNDAGAIRRSDVGVAVVECMNTFSPSSDVIVTASVVPKLENVLRFSKNAVKVVRASFFISSLYNLVGVSIAARGLLSPVVCAILMPLSSVTVVAFACGVTSWLGFRAGIDEPAPDEERAAEALRQSSPAMELLPENGSAA